MFDERWFEQLGRDAGPSESEKAPARLTSRVYSSVAMAMARSRPLLDLTESLTAGERLCIFERSLTVLPVGTAARCMNPCRVCHARVLGERLEHAPIFWPGCPYSEFHNG
jgi:hypothetical protein